MEHGGWTTQMSQILAREGEDTNDMQEHFTFAATFAAKISHESLPFNPYLHRGPAQGHNEDGGRVHFLPLTTTILSFFLHPGKYLDAAAADSAFRRAPRRAT